MDTLSDVERQHAHFILGMDGGNHATAYLAVELLRQNNQISELRAIGIKKFLAAAGTVAGSAIAAFFAGSHGMGALKP
jgi:hypothetical protein